MNSENLRPDEIKKIIYEVKKKPAKRLKII